MTWERTTAPWLSPHAWCWKRTIRGVQHYGHARTKWGAYRKSMELG